MGAALAPLHVVLRTGRGRRIAGLAERFVSLDQHPAKVLPRPHAYWRVK